MRHITVEKQLLNQSKSVRDLKAKQKEKICNNLSEVLKQFLCKNNRKPYGKEKEEIIMIVYDNFRKSGNWLSFVEFTKYANPKLSKKIKHHEEEITLLKSKIDKF